MLDVRTNAVPIGGEGSYSAFKKGRKGKPAQSIGWTVVTNDNCKRSSLWFSFPKELTKSDSNPGGWEAVPATKDGEPISLKALKAAWGKGRRLPGPADPDGEFAEFMSRTYLSLEL